ncbi:MAG: TIGR02452 family protein [Prochlorotrichaceae cyanobacterium]
MSEKNNSQLHILPCLDSDQMSLARQQELHIPKAVAATLGQSALEALRTGFYVTQMGQKVVWGDAVQLACAAKLSLSPSTTLPSHESPSFPETRVQVTNETTLGASLRLTEQGLRPLALNFANGIEPGGGFLNGARAQEEVLCRSSALYGTLVGDPMYEAHRKRELPDSTDWAIYSPDVPVFRRDDGTELPKPWSLSILTCAAPYTPTVGQPLSGDLLQKRIQRVLAIAQAYRYSTLVLGAWGCGAFHNDPLRTAGDFRQALEDDYRGVFSDIVFAIVDWSPERKFLGPFRDVFSSEDR